MSMKYKNIEETFPDIWRLNAQEKTETLTEIWQITKQHLFLLKLNICSFFSVFCTMFG